MTFDDLPSGAVVFIDANCLVYAATSDPTFGAACERLLDRIENKLLQGCTSAHVLGDLSHRLMTIEAALTFNRPMTGIANWLRRHPAEVQQLIQYRRSLDDLQAIPLPILPVTGTLVSDGVRNYSHIRRKSLSGGTSAQDSGHNRPAPVASRLSQFQSQTADRVVCEESTNFTASGAHGGRN
jgi:predicted nucleic acid-binding protein